ERRVSREVDREIEEQAGGAVVAAGVSGRVAGDGRFELEGVPPGRGGECEGAVTGAVGVAVGGVSALAVDERNVPLEAVTGEVVDRTGDGDGRPFGVGRRGETGGQRRDDQRRRHQGGPARRDALQHCTPTAAAARGNRPVSATSAPLGPPRGWGGQGCDSTSRRRIPRTPGETSPNRHRGRSGAMAADGSGTGKAPL